MENVLRESKLWPVAMWSFVLILMTAVILGGALMVRELTRPQPVACSRSI